MSHSSRNFLFILLALAALTVSKAQAQDQIVISEVFYGGSAQEDWIELYNPGAEAVDLTNYWFCTRFQYLRLGQIEGGNVTIEPGEYLVIFPGLNLDDSAADIGLYSTNAFSSANAMVDFLQYGTGQDVGRVDVAVTAGLWTGASDIYGDNFDFVATAAEDQSVSYCGDFATAENRSSEFRNGVRTRGAANRCGEEAAATDGDIRIVEVVYGGAAEADWIELVNFSEFAVDLAEFRFCSERTYVRLGDVIEGST
ncbi:MAG: lamin tail domain-containing protein, partial [Pseudomonadota bacterium]